LGIRWVQGSLHQLLLLWEYEKMMRMVASSNSSFLSAKWANRFLQSAIIQGAAITFLTILFVSIQLLLSSSINIVQFLSLSFEGPAKWIYFLDSYFT
jgi:hypothetical protein